MKKAKFAIKKKKKAKLTLEAMKKAKFPIKKKKKSKLKYSLNSFPDDILLHIFSLLDFKDVATLRVVCRRFQTLCLYAPSFSFSQYPPYNSPKHCSCKHVYKFMRKLRSQRPRDLKIDHLSFSSLCRKRRHEKLHKCWLNKVFKAFRVENYLSLEYQLPSIFTDLHRLHYLKILKLDMTDEFTNVHLPNEIKLGSLERLQLKNIRTDDSVGCWVSQSFPSLKSLLLSNVTCVPTINDYFGLQTRINEIIGTSCLEDLTIECCCGLQPRIIAHNLLSLRYVDCTTNNDFSCFCSDCMWTLSIGPEVFAPNLQRLEWKGAPGTFCNKTLKNLRVATIFSTMVKFDYKSRFEFPQFFEAMNCAKILWVDTHTIKRLYERQLISFIDVCQLGLRVEKNSYKGNTRRNVLPNFLERLPNLKTLILVPYQNGDEITSAHRPFIFENALRECMKISSWNIRGLKKVMIRVENIYYAMAVMIGMLMKSCPDMEEMSLSYPSCYHKSIKNFLHSVGSASSKLSIKLNPLDERDPHSDTEVQTSSKKRKIMHYQSH